MVFQFQKVLLSFGTFIAKFWFLMKTLSMRQILFEKCPNKLFQQNRNFDESAISDNRKMSKSLLYDKGDTFLRVFIITDRKSYLEFSEAMNEFKLHPPSKELFAASRSSWSRSCTRMRNSLVTQTIHLARLNEPSMSLSQVCKIVVVFLPNMRSHAASHFFCLL